MGRTLKRVPLDFNCPLNEVWEGYIIPFHPTQCITCDQTGYSPEARKLKDDWYRFDQIGLIHRIRTAWQYNLDENDVKALLDADRLMELTHVWDKTERKWIPTTDKIPTPDTVNLAAIRNSFIHDSYSCHVCIKAKVERLGVPVECSVCKGNGYWWESPELEKQHDEWEPYEPPTGEGYQLWETTSEGSPISPVFATLDELCEYAEKHCSTFADFKVSKQEWKSMLEEDCVCHKENNIIFL